jgi:hypothetical protein
MRKRFSAVEVNGRIAGRPEQPDRPSVGGPEDGLASLVGGWEGSEDLVQAIHETPRSGPREMADLD